MDQLLVLDYKHYYNRIINEDYIEFNPISISNKKEEHLKNKKVYKYNNNYFLSSPQTHEYIGLHAKN